MTSANTSTVLDVRPVLASGGEPFDIIMDAALRTNLGEVLEIIAPFEPLPLYRVLSGRGFGHSTKERAPNEWVVRFVQLGITADVTVGEIHERHPATASILAEYGLDLCCGGEKTLGFAARAHGVEIERLLVELQEAVSPF